MQALDDARVAQRADVDGLEADLARQRRDARFRATVVADDRHGDGAARELGVEHRLGAERAERLDDVRAGREPRDAFGVRVFDRIVGEAVARHDARIGRVDDDLAAQLAERAHDVLGGAPGHREDDDVGCAPRPRPV